MAEEIKKIKHRNWHTILEMFNKITFIFKFFITENMFEKILGHDSRNNDETIYIDLFQKEMAVLIGIISLKNCFCQA